jgi:RimJ/RimL family protein N-acetyltransferase
LSRVSTVRLEPWGSGDLPLLEQLMGDPAMTLHLGGPESQAKIVERQARYEQRSDSGAGQMFKIVDGETGEGAGSVGYWERTWRDAEIYEVGWSVIPAFQGRGIATIATAEMIACARSERKHQAAHAFPSVANPSSNAICRKLGFAFLGAVGLEYPPGRPMQCNDWRLELFS